MIFAHLIPSGGKMLLLAIHRNGNVQFNSIQLLILNIAKIIVL